MAKGISIPVRVNSSGATALDEGDDQANKLIALGLGDGDSNNAFQQDEQLGEHHIFQSGGPPARAVILARVIRLFQRFERDVLFRLKQETIVWSKTAEGELELSFKFVNLESDEERVFTRVFQGVKA